MAAFLPLPRHLVHNEAVQQLTDYEYGPLNAQSPLDAAAIYAATRLAICVAEKTNQDRSFPKGRQDPADAGSLETTARREWRQEAGIAEQRLHIFPGQDCVPAAVEEYPGPNAVYFVATCNPSTDAAEPDLPMRSGAGAAPIVSSWTPPFEDAADPDPIVLTHWVRVDSILRGDFAFGTRWKLVRKALLELMARDVGFVPRRPWS